MGLTKMMQTERPQLLQIPEIAPLLGVKTARAYELVRLGIIPSVRLGKQVRVSLADLQRFIEGGGRGLPGSAAVG